MHVLSATEMQTCDRATSERFGVASIDLMRAAAAAVAAFARRQFPQAQRVTVLCGTAVSYTHLTLAIIPTIIVVAINGERGTEKLLILSQVILSLQLSFAVVPLVMFTSSRKWMGEFVNPRWLKALAWFTAVLIAGLNAWLLIETAMGR